MHKSNS